MLYVEIPPDLLEVRERVEAGDIDVIGNFRGLLPNGEYRFWGDPNKYYHYAGKTLGQVFEDVDEAVLVCERDPELIAVCFEAFFKERLVILPTMSQPKTISRQDNEHLKEQLLAGLRKTNGTTETPKSFGEEFTRYIFPVFEYLVENRGYSVEELTR